MKRCLLPLFLTFICFMASSQTRILLSNGESTLSATLADNDATRSLVELLMEKPISIDMDDYGGFEKVGELPRSLPASDTYITTVPGDIMLYLGRNIVIFYGSNSWSYTPLAKIDNASADNIREFLGSGNVKITISIAQENAVGMMMTGEHATAGEYDMQGRPVREGASCSGIHVVNGKKILR